MAKSKKCVLSVEVYKYPYSGRPNKNENYLSEKTCCYTIRTRKKIIKKAKWLIVYGDLIINLATDSIDNEIYSFKCWFLQKRDNCSSY